MVYLSWIFLFIAIILTVKLSATSSYVTLSPKIFENKIQKILDFHNTFRLCHRVPALTLDPELTKQAQQAVELLMQNGQNFKSVKTQKNYGENLFTLEESLPLDDLLSEKTALTSNFNPVITWHDEFRFYDSDNPNSAEHFTQLVWKNTRKLGCGMAQNEISTYVLCYYYPAGNLAGEYDRNVLPARRDDTDTGCMFADFTTPEGNMKILQSKQATTKRTHKMDEHKRPTGEDFTDDTASTDDDETFETIFGKRTRIPEIDSENQTFSTTTDKFPQSISTALPLPKSGSVDDSYSDKKDFMQWLLILMTFVMILLSVLLLSITAYTFYKMCICCMASSRNKKSAPTCSPDVPSPSAIANPPNKNYPNLSPGVPFGKMLSPASPTSPVLSRPSTPQNISSGPNRSRY